MTTPDIKQPVLAYKNEAFLDSDEARPLRILAEYLEPLASFRRHRIRDTIVFFGSARLAPDGPLGAYYTEARELAREVTRWSMSLAAPAHRYMEVLTLQQTEKLPRRIPVILYGSKYWNEIINLEALVRHGMIDRKDLDLFRFADDPSTALRLLQAELSPEAGIEDVAPAFAPSRVPPHQGQ